MIDLKATYRYINRKYYDNQLPKDVLIQWSKRIPPTSDACSHPHGIIKCDKYCPKKCNRHILRLHPDLKKRDRSAELAVYHETVHLSSLLGNRHLAFHGEHFNARMRELAALGALDGLL